MTTPRQTLFSQKLPCRKLVFSTQAEAQEWVRENEEGIPLYIYACETCSLWHKTEQSPYSARQTAWSQRQKQKGLCSCGKPLTFWRQFCQSCTFLHNQRIRDRRRPWSERKAA